MTTELFEQGESCKSKYLITSCIILLLSNVILTIVCIILCYNDMTIVCQFEGRLSPSVGEAIEPSCQLDCKMLTGSDYVDLLWTTLAEFPCKLLLASCIVFC